QVALVDVLRGEEEPVVVGPHRALDLAEIARHIHETAVAVGSRRATIPSLSINLVAPGERRTPAVVVEGARKVVRVGGAIALGAVVRVVEVKLGLVATEASVLRTVDRQVLVDAGEDGLPITALEEHGRQASLREPAGAVGPDAIRILRREIGMEPAVGRDLPQ